MTGSKKDRNLKNILILPGFQFKLVFFVVLAGLVCAGLNAYLYYNYVVDSYDFILRHSSLSPQLIDDRYRDLRNLGLVLALATLLVVLVIAVWATFITHRAAGSVYHIRRVIEAIRSGKTGERVHLREKDEFQDLAHSFNQMMDELQKGRAGP